MESLKKKSEFTKVYFKGKRLNTKNLTLFLLENSNRKLKLGIVVKKKVGNAVKRNRIRRILKNSFRVIEKNLIKSLSVLVVFKHSSNLSPSFLNLKNIKDEIEYSLRGVNIIK